jgi:hypothetical protein
MRSAIKANTTAAQKPGEGIRIIIPPCRIFTVGDRAPRQPVRSLLTRINLQTHTEELRVNSISYGSAPNVPIDVPIEIRPGVWKLNDSRRIFEA